MQREVDAFVLPDLEAEYSEEEGDRLDEALDKYNEIRQSLAETQVAAGGAGGDSGGHWWFRWWRLVVAVVQCTSPCLQAKAETLCVCWNKLDQDVSELTDAITKGGASSVTMERLEESIRTLKEMFIEQKPVVEVGGVVPPFSRRFMQISLQDTVPGRC